MTEQPDSRAGSPEAPTQATPAPVTENFPAPPLYDQPTLTPTGASTPSIAPAVQLAPDGAHQARPFGDYELLSEIARGGMGVVYRARERQSGRLVALKMMLADSAIDATYVQRFALEARATGELSHPGIVAIHTWGQHAGQFFYTMDYVPGFTLSRILKRRPLAVPRAVRYLLGIARAVAAAHAQGIVHRDLKPSNVVIDPTDQPRVLDFGLAKRHRPLSVARADAAVEVDAVDDVVDVLPAEPNLSVGKLLSDSKDAPPRTEKGAVLGTPAYMAPEQARGEHSKVGPGADVHALGAMFFEMLTGRPPFEAATMMDTLIEVIEKEPPALRALNRSVPKPLEQLCRRCLEKHPGHRYADAGALADDLERRWRRAAQKRRFAWLALGSGVLFGVLLFVRLAVLEREGLKLAALSQLANESTAFAGPMMQGAASILAALLGSLLSVVPFVCLLAFLLWLVAWLRYAVARTSGEGERDPAALDSEPYLRRLFAVRAEPSSREVSRTHTDAAIELADVEFGRLLGESAGCQVRKGRQKSLDRPVLIWLDPCPPAPDAPTPGVVVRHPSVLNLHAVGVSAEGQYLVTEPAAATPLVEVLERRRLEPLETVFMLVKIANALQAFHDQGVYHGRLGPDWILVQGDLEPLLCPCGVPSQADSDRQRDVAALGHWLREWLPRRSRRWRHAPLAMLYQVCDAAEAGEYQRPADLARDLERAARAANVRWWERAGGAVFLLLWLVPVLATVAGLLSDLFAGSAQGGRSSAGELSLFIAQHLILILAPSAILLGFGQGWSLVQAYRLRLHCHASRSVVRQKVLIALVQTLVAMGLPAALACYGAHDMGIRVSPLVCLLAIAELLGFWFVGIGILGLVLFGEFLRRSVSLESSSIFPGAAAVAGAPDQYHLPSPQEAAKTYGGRTRW